MYQYMLEEPTIDLRKWFDKWWSNNNEAVVSWFDPDTVVAISKIGSSMCVNEEFELVFIDDTLERFARILEFGSQYSPKFNFITQAKAALLNIFPKYELDMEVYLLAKALF